MDELEELRRKRLIELQNRQYIGDEEFQLQQQLAQLEAMVKKKLTKKALERFGNIKAAHPEKATQLLVILGQLINSGRCDEIDDEQLKDILIKLQPEKSSFRIKRV